MKTFQSLPAKHSVQACLRISLFGLAIAWSHWGHCQETSSVAQIQSSIGPNGTGSIVVEAHGHLPDPPLIYKAASNTKAIVRTEVVEQIAQVSIEVVQGTAETISFGIQGQGSVVHVAGDDLESWAVRQVDSDRFLDLRFDDEVKSAQVSVSLESRDWDAQQPTTLSLVHLTPGDAVGFDSVIDVRFSSQMEGEVTNFSGFVPLERSDESLGFQSSTGGVLELAFSRSGSSPLPVEWISPRLHGDVHADRMWVDFRLNGTVNVSEDGAEMTVLSGLAALSSAKESPDYRVLVTSEENQPVYKLAFPKAGNFEIDLQFVAKLVQPDTTGRAMDFTLTAGAVVPVTLAGLDEKLEFHRDSNSIIPIREQETWLGFLPANGRARLRWKPARTSGDGKLFFTTTGLVDGQVGAGLLRQAHQLEFQVLQGELKSVEILVQGPGEILDVQGQHVVAWKVEDADQDRKLALTLSQPVTGEMKIQVRSQTPLGAFPVRVEGMRLRPERAIRHSGFLRLTNSGSVRLEPTDLNGLTQLSPGQYPGPPRKARQVFVYRFPTSDHGFSVAADRIQPEVSVSELIVYRLADTDRAIHAEMELDIREAPIREWDFRIPADHSVVSVSGAQVADHIASTDVTDGFRNLKVLFGQDVSGRQLVTLHLEKSEAAAAGTWGLPRIDHPNAKEVRGNLGITGAPGFRISMESSQLLVEKPLSYFPKPTAGLQQAFRIRESGWSAAMRIELLDRSIQADVFHLYSLNEQTVYGSALINYFVTGAPVSEWKIAVPSGLGNVIVDGQDVRTWRREDDTLTVSLHQPVMGAATLLVTFEEKPDSNTGTFRPGQVTPLDVSGERGIIQIVSPVQVEIDPVVVSPELLQLDPLELPAEFRLLSDAPPLGTWQYTERTFELDLQVKWFEPGTTLTQVVEFSEANSRVSKDGELVTDVLYYIKSRGQRMLRIHLPASPVRLWEVAVNNQVVTARQSEDATLIPLPGGTDPNVPIEVRLRLGKPAIDDRNAQVALPVVDAPVLKTQWKITGDEQQVLLPSGGTVSPTVSVSRPSGFTWVARRGLVALLLIGLFSVIGRWASNQSTPWRLIGLVSLGVAISICWTTAGTAMGERGSIDPLELSLPVLSAGDSVELHVQNVPLWQVDVSWIGWFACVIGFGFIAWSLTHSPAWSFWKQSDSEESDPLQGANQDASVSWKNDQRIWIRTIGMLLMACGVLMQGGGAPWFFALLALAILVVLFITPAIQTARSCWRWLSRMFSKWFTRRAESSSKDAPAKDAGGAITASMGMMIVLSLQSTTLFADAPVELKAADSVQQQWTITQEDQRLRASGSIQVTGTPGDRFLLLRSPAVLTRFEGEGLRLAKLKLSDDEWAYVINVPSETSSVQDTDESSLRSDETEEIAKRTWVANFEYQLESIQVNQGLPVLSGGAAVNELEVSYDEPGWDVFCSEAVRVLVTSDDDQKTSAKILLGFGKANIRLAPKARDVTNEDTLFFVEASNLYQPGPGVIDGRHRVQIRPSQGQLRELTVSIPTDLTVSSVQGPVASWQFNADERRLSMQVEPAQSRPFTITIETQRGLESMPAEVQLAPVRVLGCESEVGLVAIAFGPDAQPEKVEAQGMSAVNLNDFDTSLQGDQQAVIHRVYRYGQSDAELSLRVIPVEPEVRVVSKQVLSLGDERVVLSVNFTCDISRAGLFQLSFPLPLGLEVESLTGSALHHWAELSEGDQRTIILHLNGKTIGSQSFAMTLTGPTPAGPGEWTIPKFQISEASRQTGELIVQPTTGIRLRTISRQNVSETDPRNLGGKGQGTLAFRLLQRDWNLVLGIEKLDAWITGEVLHDMTLREGQTRSTISAEVQIQNASIRSLEVVLPITNPDEIKTLRASGETVSDLIRTSADSNIWRLQFKRRVIGRIPFRIEYERRGARQNESESLLPARFPAARQISYFFGVRAGGRLELTHEPMTRGWQRTDWNTVPSTLREAGNRTSPALVFRAIAPANPLLVLLQRHTLAEALKLRIAKGTLTTVLSPTGNQLTAVDVDMEVIQRSSLTVQLPPNGSLFSVFVNDESVNSIRLDDSGNTWQFYILPGVNDRTANVRLVYSVPGTQLSRLTLVSPQLNVPLENIQWNVVAPEGFELTGDDGNLELVRHANQNDYDRESYLSKVSGKRKSQAQQAARLLQQANQLLQAGEQTKARRALSSVANQYALDAASNEDARIQLETLQTQQAMVGLNTRRQRLFLDNKLVDSDASDNQQLREAAAINPILQQQDLNFRPQQLSDLLRGNSNEDNVVLHQIAARLVQHQHATDLAPQAILISLPEEGSVYTFRRTVQVAEDIPLSLDLKFDRELRVPFWQSFIAVALLTLLAGGLAYVSAQGSFIRSAMK